MTHEEKIGRWLAGLERGIEIGAFNCPLPLIRPIYVDIFTEFAGQACRVDVLADSAKLPFADNALDYVAASHVLEHIANPLAALAEWARVTRHGGRVYLVVPDRNHTWERARQPVSVQHLLDDFAAGTTQSDGTHVDDFVGTLDWAEFSPADPSEDARERYRRLLGEAVAAGRDINIHFHAFEPDTLPPVVEAANRILGDRAHLEMLDFAVRFPQQCPNGILAVLGVGKS